MQSFNIALDATNKAYNSQGSAIQENQKYLDSIQGRYKILGTTIEETFAILMSKDEVKAFITGATNLVDSLNSVIKIMGAIPLATGSALMALSVFKKEWSAIQISTDLTKTNGVFLGNFRISGVLIDGIKNAKTVIKDFSTKWDDLNKQSMYTNGIFNQIPTNLTRVKNGFEALKISTIGQTVATKALGVATTVANGIIGAGIGWLISVGITAITKYINRMDDMKNSTNELLISVKQNISQNNENIKYLNEVSTEYENLKNKTIKTADETKRFNEINSEIARMFPNIVQGYDSQGNAIIDVNTNISDLIKNMEKLNEMEENRKLVGSDNAFKVMAKDIEKYQKKIDELNKGDVAFQKANVDIFQDIIDNPDSTPEQVENAKKALDSWNQDLIKSQAQVQLYKNEINKAQDSFRAFGEAVIKSSDGFKNLDENTKGIALKIYKNFDFTQFMQDGKINMNEFQTFFINMLNDLNNKSSDTNKVVQKIKDLNNSFENSEKTQKDVDEYNKKLGQLALIYQTIAGLPPIEFINLFKIDPKPVEESKESLLSLNDIEGKLVSKLNEAKKEFDDINAILQDYHNNHTMNINDVMKLAEKYPQLLLMLGDEKTLYNELIRIQQEKVSKTQMSYDLELNALQNSINARIVGYKTDLENWTNAEEAKLKITESVLNEVARLYNQTFESTNGDSDEALLRATKYQQRLMNKVKAVMPDVDKYFELKNLDISEYLSNPKKIKNPKDSSSKTEYTATLDFTDEYTKRLADINNELTIQDNKLSVLSDKISMYKQKGDLTSLNEALKEQNKLLEEQKNKYQSLQEANDKRIKVAQDIEKEVKSNFNINVRSMSQEEFRSAFENQVMKNYGKYYNAESKQFNFGTDKTAKDMEKKFKDKTSLFDKLSNAYFKTLSDMSQTDKDILSTYNDMLSTQNQINVDTIDNKLKELDKTTKPLTDNLDKLDLKNRLLSDNDTAGKVEVLNDKVSTTKEYINDLQKAIDDLNKNTPTTIKDTEYYKEKLSELQKKLDEGKISIKGYANELADLNSKQREDNLQDFKKAQDTIVKLIKQQYETEKKSIQDLSKAREDSIRKQMDDLDKLYEKENYQSELDDLITEETKIQREIDKYSLSTDYADQLKAKELKEELANKQKEISDKQNKHEYDTRKENLNDQLDLLKNNTDKELSDLETKYSDENIMIMANEMLFNGSVDSMKNTFKAFIDESVNGVYILGQKFEEFVNIINKGKTALGDLNITSPQQASEVENAEIGNNPFGMTKTDFAKYLQNKKDYSEGKRVEETSKENAELRKKYNVKKDTFSYEDIKGFYHVGGFVGGKPLDPKHEEIARMLKGELVLNQEQLNSIPNNIAKYIPNFNITQPKISGNMNGLGNGVTLEFQNLLNIENMTEGTLSNTELISKQIMDNVYTKLKQVGIRQGLTRGIV